MKSGQYRTLKHEDWMVLVSNERKRADALKIENDRLRLALRDLREQINRALENR